jgi:hypothetical protein
LPNQQAEVVAEPHASNSRNTRKRARSKHRRNNDRSEAQANLGTEIKVHNLLKYPSSAAIV